MTAAASDPRPDVSYTTEGDGIVASCQGCCWETWRPVKGAAESAAAEHKKCRADDVAFLQRRRQAKRAGRR